MENPVSSKMILTVWCMVTSVQTLIQDESAIGVDGEKSAAAANTPPPPGGDRQLMAVCTDKGAVVYALPSHRDTIQQKKNVA